MGNLIPRAISNIFSTKETRIFMIGLDGCGKTTILYKLKSGNLFTTTSPTDGFNIETVDIDDMTLTIWDIGGHATNRPLYRHYFRDAHGVIFVIDSSNRERFSEAREELHRISNDVETSGTVLLVLANKQDMQGAMSVAEIQDKLGLDIMQLRAWYIQATCATSGNGLIEGLHWLSANIK